jgi:hypothetical protein
MDIDRPVLDTDVAMTRLALAVFLTCLLHQQWSHGQSITTEAAVSAGASTDDVSAVAAQLRAFGDVKGGVRFFGEAAWARSSDTDNDSFAAAYPYGNRVQIIEAYAERLFRPREALVGARAGRFRTPFGISSASDHAYSGFLRPPLVRYDAHAGVSNYDIEQGADFVAGIPRLTVETALGAPADVGAATRASGLDAIVRVQASFGPFIAGASHMRTSPVRSADVDRGRASATGLDLRWMSGGVQLRGEWIAGRPFGDTTTTGWYADALVHHVGMGPVTAVARIEQLDYYETDSPEEELQRRQTIGARIRLPEGLSLNVNLLHRSGQLGEYRPTTLDVGLTWSVRRYR